MTHAAICGNHHYRPVMLCSCVITWARRGRASDDRETGMRIVTLLMIVWLIIGALAGYQRHYYNGSLSCAHAGTVAATILAGPLNYFGANPKLNCRLPQPSK